MNEEVKSVKFCTKCGAENEKYSKSCIRCDGLFPKSDSLTPEEQKERKVRIKAILLYFVGYTIVGVGVLALLAAFGFIISSGSLDLDLITSSVYEIIFKWQIVLDVVFLGIIIFVCRSMFSLDNIKEKNIGKIVLITVGLGVAFLAVNICLSYIIDLISGGGSGSNEEALEIMFNVAPYSLVFSAVIFAPIVEEIVFRGAIFNLLYKEDKPYKAILISGLLFGLLHVFSGLLGGSFVELLYLIIYFTMGAILGFIYHKTKNIYICIGVHFINNLISVIIMFISLS